MKNIFKIIVFILFFKSSLFAQITLKEKEIDTVAQEVKMLYNQKDLAAIYALTTNNFQTQVPYAELNTAYQKKVFPLGKIIAFYFNKNSNGFNVYKAKMEYGDSLQLIIALDDNKKIDGFAMRPYPPAIKESDKRKKYYHDNALKTTLDSLVHKYASNFIETSKSPGLAIGILIGTKSYFYNYGDAKKGEDIHPTKKTIFEIGSITKTFTALLLADAVIKNKIKLDDPITKYLPDSLSSNTDLQKITINQLANHSSGLPSLPINLYVGSKDKNDPYAQYDDQHLFAYLKHFKADRKPGDKYEYSNLGIGLLGVIMERLNNLPLEEQYKQIIFQPLKMMNTYGSPIKDSSMTAVGYDENGKVTNYWNFDALAGAGSLKSTTEDLINYSIPFALMPRMKGKYDERILLLQKITLKEKPTQVSLAWHFNTEDSTNFIMWHNGGTGGFRSMISIVPGKKLAVVALNNCAGEPGSQVVVDAIMKALIKMND